MRPKAIRLVAKWEFTMAVMRPGFLIALFGLPLAHLGLAALIGFSMMAAMRENPPERPIAIVDPAGVLRQIDGMEVVKADESSVLRALRERRWDAAFILDDDYIATGRVRAYAPPAPGLLQIGHRLSQRERAATAIRRGLALGVPADVRGRLVEPIVDITSYRVEPTKVVAEPPFAALAVLAGPFGVCFVLGLAIFLVSGTLQQAMSSELQNRMLEVLLAHVTPLQLLTGKIAGLALAGLIQVVVYLAFTVGFGPSFFLGDIPGSVLAWSAVVFVAGYVLFAVLLAGTGILARDAHEGTQVASLCLVGSAVPFFFITHISAYPMSVLSRTLTWFPPTAPVALLLRIGVDGVGVMERVGVLVAVLACATVSLWLTAWLFAARVRGVRVASLLRAPVFRPPAGSARRSTPTS